MNGIVCLFFILVVYVYVSVAIHEFRKDVTNFITLQNYFAEYKLENFP